MNVEDVIKSLIEEDKMDKRQQIFLKRALSNDGKGKFDNKVMESTIEGLKAFHTRAPKLFKDEETELPIDFMKDLYEVFKAWPQELSPRFIALATEIIAIAAVSRKNYDHPELKEDDYFAFIGSFSALANSFKHK